MKAIIISIPSAAYHLLLVVCGCMLCMHCSPSSSNSIPQNDTANTLEALSLLGDTLIPPKDDEETFKEKDSLLFETLQLYNTDNEDLENIIWYGRRLAYLYKYEEAIEVFSNGIKFHPDAPELYRHRGHRYITTRQFDLAISDLNRGIELARNRPIETEPDGIPNKLNIPLSNLHFNLYYHLGLAYYLVSDYPNAIRAFENCMTYSINPDLKVATSDWLYLAYMRSGNKSKAIALLEEINPDMEIIENEAYLDRLLIYKGEKDPPLIQDSITDQVMAATLSYGISCWHELNGRSNEASAIRRHILTDGFWPAFGYIAAEADSAAILKKHTTPDSLNMSN